MEEFKLACQPWRLLQSAQLLLRQLHSHCWLSRHLENLDFNPQRWYCDNWVHKAVVLWLLYQAGKVTTKEKTPAYQRLIILFLIKRRAGVLGSLAESPSPIRRFIIISNSNSMSRGSDTPSVVPRGLVCMWHTCTCRQNTCTHKVTIMINSKTPYLRWQRQTREDGFYHLRQMRKATCLWSPGKVLSIVEEKYNH